MLSGVLRLTQTNRTIQTLMEPSLLSLIFTMGMFEVPGESFANEVIGTSMASSPSSYTTTILEYLKRFKNGRYRFEILGASSGYLEEYANILSFLTWSIRDIPYRKDDQLIQCIFSYIDNVDRLEYINESNISQVRRQTHILLRDTESFLNAIYYLYRASHWQINYHFIMDYVQKRLGLCYYFD